MTLLHRLWRDARGSYAVEFAIICPVLLAILFGLSDLAYQGYMQDVLTGAVQKAGRDSSIQGAAAQLTQIDAKVQAPIKAIAGSDPQLAFTSSRMSYADYASIAPEPYVDNNTNGVLDAGECFTDINGNGKWDQDPGASGQGGAGDVAVYTMQVKFSRLFPFTAWVGLASTVTISARTMLLNQPYAGKSSATVNTICI